MATYRLTRFAALTFALFITDSSRAATAAEKDDRLKQALQRYPEADTNKDGRYQEIDDRPGFYGLKSDEELRGPVGRRIRADCDMRGLISRDDPPVFLNSGMPGGDLTSRGHLLHHPKHAKAIYDRCRETGVGVVAQIPGLEIKPGSDNPQNLREFLFQQLKVGPAAGKPAGAKSPQ